MRNLIVILMLLSTILVYGQVEDCKCCTLEHKNFDFWVGKWIVTNPDGSLAGKNVIKKVQNNCILQENWTSAKGNYTGTSNNFYNAVSGKWEQIWIDNQGGSLHLKGNRVGQRMILRSEDLKGKEGESFYHKITWTKNDDGTVRQLWETITNGDNITIAFDGLYKKDNN